MDTFYQFTKFAKQQQNFLETIHGLTSRVIKKRKAEVFEKSDATIEPAIVKKEFKKESTVDKKSQEPEMKYVRDDLDDIDENDVGWYFFKYIRVSESKKYINKSSNRYFKWWVFFWK